MTRLSARRREAAVGLAYAALPLAGLAVFFAAPFCVSVWMTFQSGIGERWFVGLYHYRDLLGSAAFRLAAWNTARFMGVGVPLMITLALTAALAMTGALRWKAGFRAALMLPMVAPSAAAALFFKALFGRSLATEQAFYALILIYVWRNVGYNIVLFMAGLSRIPSDLYEAAKLDGAGGVTRFANVTLPLLAPTLFFVFVMTVIQAFKSYREVFALSGALPEPSVYMLQHFMNNNMANLNYQRLGAAAVLLFLAVFAVTGALYLLSRRIGDYEL